MNSTPRTNRIHIGIYGVSNSGKSSFMNNLIGRELSIVSEIRGTTTDPILKNFEIGGLGPVTLIDTGGSSDETPLGKKRYEKTLETISKVDLAIYLLDIENINYEDYTYFKDVAEKNKLKIIPVFTKIDLLSESQLKDKKLEIEKEIRDCLYISNMDFNKEVIFDEIKKNVLIKETSILAGVLEEGSDILMVVSIDSEYPDGRIIFPQSQMIRDGLKNKHFLTIVEDVNLETYLSKGNNIDLVIVDSKIFKEVEAVLDQDILLTSFSILLANYKGDLNQYLEGIRFMEENRSSKLKILIYESCHHTSNHEDIGTVKIPSILKKFFEGNVEIDFSNGGSANDFLNYDLVIHCGACMESSTQMMNKLDLIKSTETHIVNYGIFLAYFAGMLERSIRPFKF